MTNQVDLVAMCKRGEPAAYTRLYDLHASAVYSSVLRLVEHTAEAEDILQESFVAAFQGINGLKNTGGFRAWIKRIAINKSVDLIRKRKLRFVELEAGWILDEDDDKVDETEFRFTVDAIAEAVAALPDGYRTIFNLYVMENIPHGEIGQMLGMENATVRSQYHRARLRILNTLKQGGYHAKRA